MSNALELLPILQANRKRLSCLDWTSLKFQPNVPPSLQSYLTSFPLEGLVETGIQAVWNSVLGDFFGKYFGTNAYWRFLGFDSIHNLVGDATVLLNALTCFINYLETSNDDTDTRKQFLRSTIESLRSNPLWDENEFIALGLEI